MKAHELFQAITPSFAKQILGYYRDEERDIYKSTIASIAVQKKLRPVFVQRKSGPDQMAWLLKILQQRSGSSVAEHLLQVWLLKKHVPMLIMFLDALGIEHNGEGAVDELPDTIDAEKAKAAIDDLLSKYPSPLITLYLRLFQLQQTNGWPEIADRLENDDRLTLEGEVPDEVATPKRAPEEAPSEEAPPQEEPSEEKSTV